MSALRGSAQRTAATQVQVTVRPLTLALAALVVAAALTVAIVLAANAGNDQAGYTKSVRVVPSAPIPPSAAERHQQPGLNGPGMRP